MFIPLQFFRTQARSGDGAGYWPHQASEIDVIGRQMSPEDIFSDGSVVLYHSETPVAPTSSFYSPTAVVPIQTGVLTPTIYSDPGSPTNIASLSSGSPDLLSSLPPAPSETVPAQNLADATSPAPVIITATVYAFPPSESPASLSAGAGAGIAIAICVIIAALATTAFVFWTRRRSRYSTPRSFSGFDRPAQVGRMFSVSPSLQVNLPPEALRTSPYTVRKPPPRYTIIENTSPFSPATSPCEKPIIAYPDVVYIEGTRVPSLPNTHVSPTIDTLDSDAEVISISKHDSADFVHHEVNLNCNNLQLPDLVLKHPGYLSPLSGSVRMGRLLRSFTERTTASTSQRSTREPNGRGGLGEFNPKMGSTAIGRYSVEGNVPPFYPSFLPNPSSATPHAEATTFRNFNVAN